MTDIIERLRAAAEFNTERGSAETVDVCNEAADEIKLLRMMTAGSAKSLMKEIRTNLKTANTKPDPSLLDEARLDQRHELSSDTKKALKRIDKAMKIAQDTQSETADHIGDD